MLSLLIAGTGWSFGGHRDPFKAFQHDSEVGTAIQNARQKYPDCTWLTVDDIKKEVARVRSGSNVQTHQQSQQHGKRLHPQRLPSTTGTQKRNWMI